MTARMLGHGASIAITIGAVATAIVIGGGVPLSPAELARGAEAAAANSAAAADDLDSARRSTLALSEIATNVRAQLQTSRRLLATQLRIERLSRSGVHLGRVINRRIATIASILGRVRAALVKLTALSDSAVLVASDSAASARRLSETLLGLEALYYEVIEESRELNRKARGYERIREGP